MNIVSNTASYVADELRRLVNRPTWVSKEDNSHMQHCEVAGGFKYVVDPMDTTISGFLRKGIPWESFMHQYFDAYAVTGDGALCLDIGANLGAHSVYLSTKFDHVWSFEPQSKVCQQLEQNVELNSCANVKVLQVGLGSVASSSAMTFVEDNKSYNLGSIKIEPDGSQGGEQIQVVTLDSYDAEITEANLSLRFIKIDVEGYEARALKGGQSLIAKHLPVIILEEKSASMFKKGRPESFQILEDLGYTIKRISIWDDFLATPPHKR